MPSVNESNLNLPINSTDVISLTSENQKNTSNEADTSKKTITDKTSEDNLVSFEEESGTEKNSSTKTGGAATVSTGNAALDGYYLQQQSEINRMEQIQQRIEKRTQDLAKLKKRLNSSVLSDNAKNSLKTNIGKVQSDISSLNSELNKCQSNLSSISSNIQNALQQIAAQAQAQAQAQAAQAATANTAGVAGATPVASTQNTNYAGIQVTTIPADLVQRIDAKLGAGFCAKVEEVSAKLNCNPNDLLAMMYSESGLDPHYYASDGTVGLISWLSEILSEKGYDPAQVAAMSGIDQMDLVCQFIQEGKGYAGYSDSDVLDTGTLYAINFLPGYANREILCSSTGDTAWAYNANTPLDVDGDGNTTKSDLAVVLQRKFEELQQYF